MSGEKANVHLLDEILASVTLPFATKELIGAGAEGV
jgi:hypothetical protein